MFFGFADSDLLCQREKHMERVFAALLDSFEGKDIAFLSVLWKRKQQYALQKENIRAVPAIVCQIRQPISLSEISENKLRKA